MPEQTVIDLISPEQRIASLEKALAHERECRALEHDTFVKHKDLLHHHLTILKRKAEQRREAEAKQTQKKKRSLTQFVIIALCAIVLLIVPCTLQKLCIIGPQLSYGIECGLLMVACWCYALLWERTRK